MEPLRLSLDPILPDRAPGRRDQTLKYGYRLRLPDGPVVRSDDALLAAFGAVVVSLQTTDDVEQALQDERFEPGSILRLMAEPFDEDDPCSVRVWDAQTVLEIGELSPRAAELALAGEEAGLAPTGLVLAETRMLHDHRRTELEILVRSPQLVEVDLPPQTRFPRPQRPSRPRVVLCATGSPDIRWWDPTGSDGPGDIGDLPVSAELAQQLLRLRDGYRRLGDQEASGEAAGMEALEVAWEREELDSRALLLWRRARAELRRSFAVGFLGPNMRQPAWSPAQLEEPDDDEFDDLFETSA